MRNRTLHTLTFVLFLLSTTPSFAQNEVDLFESSPDNWRPEIIPFPLRFAPDIKYKGVEELRFAPGMFRPGREDYFTYAFIWRLEGRVDLPEQRLQKDLLLYFRGLYTQVSRQKQADTKTFKVSVQPFTPEEASGAQNDPPVTQFRSDVKWVDPFTTEKPVSMNMDIKTWQCDKNDTTWALFLVSPQPREHDIWKQLTGIRPQPCD